jgi:glutamate-1-semialdehyde 2,1-aminomutase
VRPDLTTLGKIIGGGLPIGAFGGRRDLMAEIAPSGPVYQAGTLAGHPLAMAAGAAVLAELTTSAPWARLEAATIRLAEGFAAAGCRVGWPIHARSAGAMWGFSFSSAPVVDFETAQNSDPVRYRRFFHAMLRRGVYLPPSPFEAGFVSTRHDERIVARTIRAAERALEQVATEPDRDSSSHQEPR